MLLIRGVDEQYKAILFSYLLLMLDWWEGGMKFFF